MIKKQTMKYNRSRQAMITKELIEIISGAKRSNIHSSRDEAWLTPHPIAHGPRHAGHRASST